MNCLWNYLIIQGSQKITFKLWRFLLAKVYYFISFLAGNQLYELMSHRRGWCCCCCCPNKSGLLAVRPGSWILFKFSTFILITKLKSLSVLNLSVRPSVCLSVFLSFYYLSDIQLSFRTSFVLMSKLKNISFFLSVFLSVCLSSCLSVSLSIFLTSCWHSQQLLFW